ncbi:hypothetical protein CLG96_12185 [Sphingomonas oleivorans]|uniref:Uncharacterized protein n=1 Tax=Sphingomonas oleivorans TaxID=1735121 RepID=A0A2T5FVW4_9SPHN|nr:hypothetical protein [Sphingomonas oleivorans]PTQ09914.1 hypothetical protein CLG96_12185 [Sphingomonas oleivorans]
MRDAQSALLRAIAAEAGPGLLVREAHSTPWASATFTGARHRLSLLLEHPATDLAARLEGMSALAGHLLADIAVSAQEGPDGTRLAIEALTIEDR